MAELTKKEIEYLNKTTKRGSLEQVYLYDCLMRGAERREERKNARKASQ